MAKLDELFSTILKHPRDTLLPITLVADFTLELVRQYPQGEPYWRKYLRERLVEDTISLHMALVAFPYKQGVSAQDVQISERIAAEILDYSPSVRVAVEVGPSESAWHLADRISRTRGFRELVQLAEMEPEVLDLTLDLGLTTASLGELWARNNVGKAKNITDTRNELHQIRKIQELGKGTLLAKHIVFYKDPAWPHPVLKDGDVFHIIAYRDLLYLAQDRTYTEILSIPWGNINLERCGRAVRRKSTFRRAMADIVNILTPFDTRYEHEGLLIDYWDPEYQSNLQVFFRLYGDPEIEEHTNAIVTHIYEYRRQGGQAPRR